MGHAATPRFRLLSLSKAAPDRAASEQVPKGSIGCSHLILGERQSAGW